MDFNSRIHTVNVKIVPRFILPSKKILIYTASIHAPVSKTVTLEKPSWPSLIAHTKPDTPPPITATDGLGVEAIICLI